MTAKERDFWSLYANIILTKNIHGHTTGWFICYAQPFV